MVMAKSLAIGSRFQENEKQMSEKQICWPFALNQRKRFNSETGRPFTPCNGKGQGVNRCKFSHQTAGLSDIELKIMQNACNNFESERQNAKLEIIRVHQNDKGRFNGHSELIAGGRLP